MCVLKLSNGILDRGALLTYRVSTSSVQSEERVKSNHEKRKHSTTKTVFLLLLLFIHERQSTTTSKGDYLCTLKSFAQQHTFFLSVSVQHLFHESVQHFRETENKNLYRILYKLSVEIQGFVLRWKSQMSEMQKSSGGDADVKSSFPELRIELDEEETVPRTENRFLQDMQSPKSFASVESLKARNLDVEGFYSASEDEEEEESEDDDNESFNFLQEVRFLSRPFISTPSFNNLSQTTKSSFVFIFGKK